MATSAASPENNTPKLKPLDNKLDVDLRNNAGVLYAIESYNFVAFAADLMNESVAKLMVR